MNFGLSRVNYNMKNSNRGFTLVEVMVASAVGAIMLAVFFQFLANQSKVAAEEVQDTNAQTGIMSSMNVILPLLQESRPTLAHPEVDAQNYFRFRVPMKYVDGTNPFKPNKQGFSQFTFGAGDPGSMSPGGYYEISFLKGYDSDTGVGRLDEELREATVLKSDGTFGVDLNGDGDLADVFTFGTLYLREFLSDASLRNERVLGGRICVPDASTPIFRLDGNSLTITFVYLDMRELRGEGSKIRQTKTQVLLRNGRPVPPEVQ